jgi:hypothetical protein
VTSNLTVLNITLQGNATLYVHGPSARVTLTVLGNIRLSGTSLLFVNSSNLSIGEAYDVEWNLQLSGSSRFLVAYSAVLTNGYQWGAAYQDNSNVTIVSSLIGYPAGWLDTELLGAARLYLQDSWYSSDVILFDNPFVPSIAQFGALDSAGFNVWLNFKAGARANLTLPGLEGWRNWTFPGTSQVSGLNYSVTIANCFVLAFAVMVWQGSNLTLTNSPDVVVALNIDNGTLSLTGLSQSHYSTYGLYSDGLSVRLQNTTAFTWNIYPFGGNVQIADSQVGEIQQFGSATTTVNASNLTASGGYYGNQGTSTLSISNSTIAGQVVGYTGLTILSKCELNTTLPSRVLATGTGMVYSEDTTLAPQDSYQTLGGGVIDVAWTVHANVTSNGLPVAGAAITVDSAASGVEIANGTTNSTGAISGPLLSAIYGAGPTVFESYEIFGASQDLLGNASLPTLDQVLWLSMALQPIIAGSSPINGATGVGVNLATVTIDFSFPMNQTATDAALGIAPVVPVLLSWSSPEALQVGLTPPLSWNTTLTIVVGSSATTTSGFPLPVPYVVTFTTEAAILPSVASVTPANGSQQVSVNSTITVVLSEPMNTTTLEAAFSIGPGAPPGRTTVNTDVLVWTPNASLEANTTYTLTISTAAVSADGAPLPHAFTSSFRTAAATGNATNPGAPTHPAGPASMPTTPWAPIGVAVAILAAVLLGAFIFLRRRAPPAAPVPAATTPPPTPAVPRAEWSEEPDIPPAGPR